MNKRSVIGLFLFVLISLGLSGQNEISFRALIKQNDQPLVEEEVYFLISIINSENAIVYEEELSAFTNSLGIVTYGIGSGVTTPNSEQEDLSAVEWNTYPFLIEVNFRLDENDPYDLLETKSLNATVYANHANYSSGEGSEVNMMFDVLFSDPEEDGSFLKYNTTNWDVSITDFISLNSGNTIQSIYSDTADFAIYLVNDSAFNYRDTILYSFLVDSINNTYLANIAESAILSTYSDTTLYADSVLNSLMLNGNDGALTFGSNDAVDVNLLTNANPRLRFIENGSINVGEASVDSGFAVKVNDGFLIEYLEDSSAALTSESLANSFFWNPRRRSLHIGNSDLYQVADSGWYSFAGGSNNISNSYSFTWGENNKATGNNVVVFGKESSATRQGLNQFASGVAMGDNCFAFRRCVALGDHARCISVETGGNSNIAIGRNIENSGSGSVSLGNNIVSEALIGGAAIGSNINSGFYYGSFIFSDANTTIVNNTADNEFIARAAGGYLFYTDSSMINGVELQSGSGSWSSISDKYKKENISKFTNANILEFIQDLPVCSWNYRTQPTTTKHLGPLSNHFVENEFFSIQKLNSFYALSSADMDGFILLGIKEANKEIEKLKQRVERESIVIENPEMIRSLEDRLKNLEKKQKDD